MSDLANILARLYEDRVTIRIFLRDIGLDPTQFNLDGNPVFRWEKVLEKAWKHQKVETIVEAAGKEFEARKAELIEAMQRYLDTRATLRDNTTKSGIMKLPGELFEQFQEALLDAFPTEADLGQMVRVRLDVNLAVITGGGSLREISFNLIRWTESQGKLEELVTAARRQNLGNEALQDFERNFKAWQDSGDGKRLKKPKVPTKKWIGISFIVRIGISFIVIVLIVFYLSMNHAPAIKKIVPANLSLRVGEKAELQVIAEDKDNDSLTYFWSAQRGIVPSGSQGNTITYTAPQESGNGFDIITVTVTDGKAEDSKTFKPLIRN